MLNGHVECAELLLERGADIDAKDGVRPTLLQGRGLLRRSAAPSAPLLGFGTCVMNSRALLPGAALLRVRV